ncbi:MAG TPA: hypothetical protein VHO25_20370 [Polyangiaceae bacterium]|nr:hypothetical protein [Polyangiaceae bacterium]
MNVKTLLVFGMMSYAGCGCDAVNAGPTGNSAVGGNAMDSSAVAEPQVEQAELRLADVDEAYAWFATANGMPAYAWICGGLTVSTLEPGRENWIEFDRVAGGAGAYVDGEFLRTLGCDVSSCESPEQWRVSRGWLERVGEVSVAPESEAPAMLEDAQAASGNAAANWNSLSIYESRTLTGRIRVSFRYWDEQACSVLYEEDESMKLFEGEFDLGD